MRVLDSSAMQIVLVTEGDGKLVGVVTDGDIRRGLLRGSSMDSPVTEIMNRTPKTLSPQETSAAARAAMLRYHVHSMPVVDGQGRVVDLRFLSDPRSGAFDEIPVVLMAGGQGKRLRPLTEDTPKPLLELGSKPILEHILDRFVAQGFRRFFISVNYLGHMIEGHFGDGTQWDVSIQYLREDQQLGTAGALTLLPEDISGPVIVMNGDLITGADFREIVHLHGETRAAATMCVREHRTQIEFGVVDTEGDFFRRVREKPVITQKINAGIYCLDQKAIRSIPKDEFYDMPTLFQELTERDHPCAIHQLNAVEWLDIGTPKEYERARALMEKRS